MCILQVLAISFLAMSPRGYIYKDSLLWDIYLEQSKIDPSILNNA